MFSKKNINYLFLLVMVGLHPFNSKGQSSQRNYIVGGKAFDVDEVNKKVEFVMKEVDVPGLSLAVINDGEIVFYNTYGYRELNARHAKKVNGKTKFEAASLSKSFVVFAAYKLVDQGLLNLDTPLYKYMEYDLLAHDERYKLITARMVLGHSSGIENHLDQNDKNKLEILADPGSAFVYSGEGYVYLTKVMARIMDMPVERFMKRVVYQPLKLEETYTTSRGRVNRNHASAHDQFGRLYERNKNKEPMMMSHIHSNAKDYAKLLIGIFDNDQIKKSSVSQILTPEVKVENQLYYGHGFELYINGSDTLAFQGGENRGFKGFGFYSPKNKSGFVYFANSQRSEKIGRVLCEILTGMDASPCYSGIYNNPYPSQANNIFKVYRKGGEGEVRKVIDNSMINEIPKGFTENDMVELVYYFKDENYELAKYIATEYFKKCPECNGKMVFNRWLKK